VLRVVQSPSFGLVETSIGKYRSVCFSTPLQRPWRRFAQSTCVCEIRIVRQVRDKNPRASWSEALVCRLLPISIKAADCLLEKVSGPKRECHYTRSFSSIDIEIKGHVQCVPHSSLFPVVYCSPLLAQSHNRCDKPKDSNGTVAEIDKT